MMKNLIRETLFSEDGLEFATSHAPYENSYDVYKKEILKWCEETGIEIEWLGFIEGSGNGPSYHFQHWKCNSKEDAFKVCLSWG